MSEQFRKRSRSTVRDVADAAGVSGGTVSAVINARGTVRDVTRRRVMDAIGLLNYELPRSPGVGGSQRTKSVGLIVKEAANPFYAEILLGARDLVTEAGYVLCEGTSEGAYHDEGRLLEAFRHQGIAGAIVAPVVEEAGDLSHLFLVQRRGYPLVLLGEVRGLPVPSVTVDNVKASKAAAEYLLSGGHERILHVSGPAYSQHSQDRMAGVREAFSESPLRFNDSMIVEGGARLEDGYRVVREVFSARDERERPTAITCFNDLVAIGALRALGELGLSVPEDVSVVGYDDIHMAAYLPTPLTTVRVPSREMGRLSADLLLRQLRGRAPEVPERTVLDADLIVRATSRPLS
ncbi:MAG: LacI family DNA-binding transcriptional regulator [Bacteroidota bacterium]